MIRYACFSAIAVIAVCLVVGSVPGCKDSTTGPGTGTVSMAAKYTNTATPLGTTTVLSTSSASSVDSIQITQARFVLARIKFESGDEDEGEGEGFDFKTGPFVLQLNLNGTVQNIAVSGVPNGTYDEVKFKIHRLDSSEITSLSPADSVAFADFLSGGRYSIIIDGTIFRLGVSTPFTYKSRVDASQKDRLNPPLVVSSSNPTANVTMSVNSHGWFRDFNGNLIDPTDSLNRGMIDENLEHSVKIFRDNDHDGKDDHDEDESGEHDHDSLDIHELGD